jgi:hypothetical protein
MAGEPFCFGLLRKREVVVPSRRGLAVLAAGFIALLGAATAGFRGAHAFLAVNRPIGGEALVVEGWIPDYAMREALAVFRSHPYALLITTGGPLPQGTAYASFGTHAQLAAATFQSFGLAADSLAAVPSPDVGRDRTFQEAVSLKEWLAARPAPFRSPRSLDVVSFSAHARRTRLLYAMALGPEVEVGVLAPKNIGYDPDTWWRTSNGVRSVLDELIAYVYAKVVFRG